MVARRIFQQTLAAIDIGAAIARSLERNGSRIRAGAGEIDLRDFEEIVAIAFGKASVAMAEGFQAALGPDFRAEGILVTPNLSARELPSWKTFVGGHPLPTAESFAAMRREVAGGVADSRGRVVHGGNAARGRSGARGFSGFARRAGEVRRAD
jgi:glycerate-2-kinase